MLGCRGQSHNCTNGVRGENIVITQTRYRRKFSRFQPLKIIFRNHIKNFVYLNADLSVSLKCSKLQCSVHKTVHR